MGEWCVVFIKDELIHRADNIMQYDARYIPCQIRGIFHLDVSFICWSLLHSWRTCWSRRQGVPKIPEWLMYTHSWMPFWTCPWGLPVSLMKIFLVKSKSSSPGTTLVNCQIIRWQITGSLLYICYDHINMLQNCKPF
jgi:hypothetical protein